MWDECASGGLKHFVSRGSRRAGRMVNQVQLLVRGIAALQLRTKKEANRTGLFGLDRQRQDSQLDLT